MIAFGFALTNFFYFSRAATGVPTGTGAMDFSIATGDDTGLLALLEDI